MGKRKMFGLIFGLLISSLFLGIAIDIEAFWLGLPSVSGIFVSGVGLIYYGLDLDD